jgi:bifunctional N-acetylglucosamine-1-phosphate-uridyltransferase/glucosamine-1-phosphate-acetyltransferase GlmU-like protein
MIMDIDFHDIHDSNGCVVNEPRDIFINNNVWMGCHVLILKGVFIGEGNIITAGCDIVGKCDLTNSIISNTKEIITLIENVKWVS